MSTSQSDAEPAALGPPRSVEETPRWVRVKLGGVTVADSRRAMLLIQYGRPPKLPTYFFPPENVLEGALVDSAEQPDGSTRWTVEAGGRRAERGAWTLPDADGPLAALNGMVTFDWWGELDWYEEEQHVFAHARDPHKRVDAIPSSRHVRVEVDGTTVAESKRPVLLFEEPLPVRYYLPEEDVRTELLEPSDASSLCPYKGKARYWSLRLGDQVKKNLVWGYPDPIPENPRIKDLLCFFNERVDLWVDGEPLPRPVTPWS